MRIFRGAMSAVANPTHSPARRAIRLSETRKTWLKALTTSALRRLRELENLLSRKCAEIPGAGRAEGLDQTYGKWQLTVSDCLR
jgi:hypothetical protein